MVRPRSWFGEARRRPPQMRCLPQRAICIRQRPGPRRHQTI